MFENEVKEFCEDTSFVDNLNLWGVFKAVLTVLIIYSAVFHIWKQTQALQDTHRTEEIGMAISALASEGYSIYIDGQRELFVPDLENYEVEFDREAHQINLRSRSTSAKDTVLNWLSIDKLLPSQG